MNRTLTLRTSALLAAFLVDGFSPSARAELIYGIASTGGAGQSLVTWDSASPGTLLSGVFLNPVGNHLKPGESILAIDFQPTNGELYGLGSTSEIYKIDLATGGTTTANGTVFAVFNPPLSGVNFGLDFNPTIDRIRVTSETNQNLVLNPITGQVQLQATNLFYGPADPNFGVDPNVTQSAYTNSFPGALSTQLYGIDAGLDILVTQANSAGTLGTVGPLGVNVGAYGGFDISAATGVAYAALTPVNSSVSNLYSINLLTGLATNLGQIDGGVFITAMAVKQGVPEPTTAGIALCAVAAAAAVRRRSALGGTP